METKTTTQKTEKPVTADKDLVVDRERFSAVTAALLRTPSKKRPQ